MSKELVERLRERCAYGDARLWQKHDPLSAEAADLIERQQEALEQIAMPQTERTPEQAVEYFQHLACSLTTKEPSVDS